MSLILDALNKADRERRSNQQTPGIDSQHHPIEAVHNSNSKLVVILMALLIGLLLVAIGIFVAIRKPEQQTAILSTNEIAAVDTNIGTAIDPTLNSAVNSPTAPAPAPTPTTVAPTPAAKKIVVAKKPEPQAVIKSSDVASLYEQPAKPAAVATPLPTLAATPAPTPAPTLKPTPAAAQSVAQSNIPARPFDPAAAKPSAEPNVKIEPTIADFTEIGDIRSLSWSEQTTIPTLNYSEHNYVENGRSTVTINGSRFKKGDRVASDLILEMILADGILLKYKSSVFKMQALNSWINM